MARETTWKRSSANSPRKLHATTKTRYHEQKSFQSKIEKRIGLSIQISNFSRRLCGGDRIAATSMKGIPAKSPGLLGTSIFSQGSSFLATLGFATQSRWDWTLQFQVRIRHRPKRCGGNSASIFRKHASHIARFRRFPRLAARLQFRGRHMQIELPLFGIDCNRIPVLHQRERATYVSLRRDMAHNESMTAARKAAIGDQRHIFAKAFAHDCRCRREHLSHARPAFGPLEPNHHHVAFLDGSIENLFQGLLF